jgi:hypothetical protein
MGASEKMRQILVNEGNLLGVGGIARPISVEVKPNNISALSRYSGRPLNFTAPKADRHSSGTDNSYDVPCGAYVVRTESLSGVQQR